MNTEQAREQFNAAIDRQTDPDQRARLELAREYFCNPEFRSAIEDHLWQVRLGGNNDPARL